MKIRENLKRWWKHSPITFCSHSISHSPKPSFVFLSLRKYIFSFLNSKTYFAKNEFWYYKLCSLFLFYLPCHLFLYFFSSTTSLLLCISKFCRNSTLYLASIIFLNWRVFASFVLWSSRCFTNDDIWKKGKQSKSIISDLLQLN